MRSLCAALFLLILILCISLWCGYEVVLATDRLSAAARRTVAEDGLSSLISLWKKDHGIISLSVNRRLVLEAEKALALMQTHASDADLSLFLSARAAFLQAIDTIRNSYSISFRSII